MSVGGEDDKVVLRSVEFWDPATKVKPFCLVLKSLDRAF